MTTDDFIRELETQILRDQDTIRRLRSALESVQWGSCDGCGNKVRCSECFGYQPHPWDDPDLDSGHQETCIVGKALTF